MFGDIGHGGLLFAFGAYLVACNESVKKSSLAPFSEARYLLFLMGLFAFYNGLIYNDFFGIPLRLFESCYNEEFERKGNCVPIFGIDIAWYQATNEVPFLNSFKMKLSIIIGVIHMCFGILMRAFNNVHFNKWTDLIFEFIPQIVFMLVTFGYMCLAIVIKWTTSWEGNSTPPSILNIYTGMGITDASSRLYGDAEGVYQTQVQQGLFIIAGICLPLMLFPKPLILICKGSGHKEQHQEDFDEEGLTTKLVEDGQDSDFDPYQREVHAPKLEVEHNDGAGEIFIHQLIEVIEFALGSVSNTASYLRLWALSLAHSQLAKVFLDMTVLAGIKSHNFIAVIVMFPLFVACTLGVLMCMDNMECFLHALRLHWVEFQGKFFKGDGHKFAPLNFKSSIKEGLEVIGKTSS